MNKNICTMIVVLFFSFFAAAGLFADEDEDTTPAPYTADEFPQWAKELRRTEIITFGSLPFVNLSTTFVYSFYRYYEHGFSSDYIPNPLAKTSDSANLDSDEQKMILLTSVGISVGLGIFDFIINKIRYENKKISRYDNSIIITSEGVEKPGDLRASVNPSSADNKNGEKADNSDTEANPEISKRNDRYMIGGMESAVF